jgi:hypothetical protein
LVYGGEGVLKLAEGLEHNAKFLEKLLSHRVTARIQRVQYFPLVIVSYSDIIFTKL